MIEIITDEFLYSEYMDKFYIRKESEIEFIYCEKEFFDYKFQATKYTYSTCRTDDSIFKYKTHFYKTEFFLSFVRFLCNVDINILIYVNPNHFSSINEYISLFDEMIIRQPKCISYLNQDNVSKKQCERLIKLALSKDDTILDRLKFKKYKLLI
jgi:hypothetical protein